MNALILIAGVKNQVRMSVLLIVIINAAIHLKEQERSHTYKELYSKIVYG